MNNTVMKLEHTLTIALTKGRILKETLPLLAEVGITPQEDLDSSRKLIVATTVPNVSLVILRGSDVPTYVRHGAADLGIAGKDMLLEFGGEGIYEPLDLGIARCRLMTAGPASDPTEDGGRRRVRVATKFMNVARAHYARKGLHADLIKLYGSMELAPLVGLADAIVDLVDTGSTLKANGLVEYQQVTAVSARLVVNKASMKTKHARLGELLGKLREVLGDA